jgi:N-acetylglucosaminyldiphosphoundecaprenol N-acetyl-beta-D-mannosaminyltransferase
VLGSQIDVVSWEEALQRIEIWAKARQSRYVCICNVHSVITAEENPQFQSIVNAADMATPDGAPIAWSLRGEGHVHQERINGPDLMWKQLAQAERLGLVVSFYGSAARTLAYLKKSVLTFFPGLQIGVMISPPFRPLTPEENDAYIAEINQAKTQVLYVGLGCPKQEFWMAQRRGQIHAVMLGVGAAFDYHAGTVKRAPVWMQQRGLEWLHRLCTEPGRLWRRYLTTNTRFVRRMIENRYKAKGRKNGKPN